MSYSEENYYNEDGNTKYLPNEFYYDKFEFKEYNYNKKENRICAIIDDGVKICDCKEEIKCQSLDLLLNFILIWKEFENNLFLSPNKLLFCDLYLKDKELENVYNTIIKWCKNYGFPIKIDINKYDNNKTVRLFKSVSKRNVDFSLTEFLVSLNDTYCLYNIYQVLIGEKEKIQKPTFININDGFPSKKADFKNIEKCTKEELIEIFKDKYNQLNLQGVIKFDDAAFVDIKVDNLFDAVAYQIVLNMYNPYKEIKFCKRCRKPFEVTNRKQLYCNNPCNPKNAYAERKRKRQKNKPAN